MEIRQYLPPHRDLLAAKAPGMVTMPPPNPEEVFKLVPVARVVLSFSAVRALKVYLDQALPQMETARKVGQ